MTADFFISFNIKYRVALKKEICGHLRFSLRYLRAIIMQKFFILIP